MRLNSIIESHILCWQEKDILILECVFCVHSEVISPLNFIATCKIFEEHPLFISNSTLGNFLSVINLFVTSYGFTENCFFFNFTWGNSVSIYNFFLFLQMTKRFTVNLPGGQKKVLRISPQLTLEQVRAQLCQERQLDPSRLVFQLPTSPGQQLSLGTTISELPANEVNLVSANGEFM